MSRRRGRKPLGPGGRPYLEPGLASRLSVTGNSSHTSRAASRDSFCLALSRIRPSKRRRSREVRAEPLGKLLNKDLLVLLLLVALLALLARPVLDKYYSAYKRLVVAVGAAIAVEELARQLLLAGVVQKGPRVVAVLWVSLV